MQLNWIATRKGMYHSFEPFKKNPLARTQIGQLLRILAEEDPPGLAPYSLSASFSELEVRLIVSHHAFPVSYQDLIIETSHDGDLTVEDVEIAIRTHLNRCHSAVRESARQMELKLGDIEATLRQISIDKARAAIIAAFPDEAIGEYLPIQQTFQDFWTFAKKGDDRTLYAARQVDVVGNFVAIRLDNTSIAEWAEEMGEDINCGGRYGFFLMTLAEAYAASELGLDSTKFGWKHVLGAEVPGRLGINRFTNVKAVMSVNWLHEEEGDVIVEFDANNMPTNACLT